MADVLILGSKEYPFGTNNGEDPYPGGGMETYVHDLVPELSRLCGVQVITRKFKGARDFERRDSARIHRVPWLGGRWLRNPSFNMFSLFKGLSVARDADIIYSNGFVAGLAGLAIARLKGKKTVFRPAGIAYSQQSGLIRNIVFALERLVFKHSDAVLFHSEGEMGNAKRAFGLSMEHGHVILTGFPVERFASRRRVRKSRVAPGLGRGRIIASVSRLVRVKGVGLLIRAFKGLSRDAKLLIAGTGPEEGRLKRLSEEIGVAGDVRFLGFRRDVPEILSAADIFVVSSLSEGLPTSLLEAMAAGKACIVTDIGLPVKHMETGLVVEPGNEMALRNAMDALLRDGALRKRLGENAREFTRSNCTQMMAARAHRELFDKVLSS